MSELNALIQKYNSDKEAIASTLIYAQSTSDKTLSDARKKADEIVSEANARAESEYAEKIRLAEEKLSNLEEDYAKTKISLEEYSAAYTENINAQAKEIIEKANAQAAKIIADAKTEIGKVEKDNAANVKAAKTELKKISDLISKFCSELDSTIADVSSLSEDISSKVTVATGKFDFSDIEAQTADIDEIEPFVMPDFEELLNDAMKENGKDISSGRFVEDNSISGVPKYEVENINEYITKIFDAVGGDAKDFSSYKEGLDEIFSRDVSLASKPDENGEEIEE